MNTLAALPCRRHYKKPLPDAIKLYKPTPRKTWSDIERLRKEHNLKPADLRELVGYTQMDLAFILGVHHRTISDWECRKKMPRLDYAASLAIVLGVSNDLVIEAFVGV